MKKISILVLLFLSFQSIVFAQEIDSLKIESKIIDFGKEIFSSFQKEDTVRFDHLVANRQSILISFENNITDPDYRTKVIAKTRKDWKVIDKKYLFQSKKDFRQLLKLGKTLKIRWKKIKFEEFSYHRTKKIPGIPNFNARLYFSYKKKKYYIYMRDVFWLTDEWKIMEMRATDIIEISK